MDTPKEILEAEKIAIRDLRSNYGKLGIYAGPKNHHEYWARDSFFASFGACSLGDFEIVRKNLDLFIKYQKENGQIALRIEERNHSLHFLGIEVKYDPPVARFKCSQPWATDVVDASALFVISALNYSKVSGDKKWLVRNMPSVIKATNWLLKRKNKLGLIDENFMASWADMILKKGSVTYTNACIWKALKEMSAVDKKWLGEESSLKGSINRRLWSKERGYFVDWIGRGGRVHDYFFTDGNLLAIVWGLADRKKAKSIFKFIDDNGLGKIPVTCGHPRLDWWNDLINKIVFPMYQTKYTFLWWGCFSVIARRNTGNITGAYRDLLKVSQKIVEYGTCHEVLTEAGEPVNLWLYKSEKQIAWTAGIYIYAYNSLVRKKYEAGES